MIEDFSASDHQYLYYKITEEIISRPQKHQPTQRWNVERLDKDLFSAMIAMGKGGLDKVPQRENGRVNATELVESTMNLLARTCNSSMPRRKPVRNRRPAYWWNEDIAELRRVCLQRRRLPQRTPRGSPEFEERNLQYKQSKKTLKATIGKSKAQKWNELIEDIEREPWGLGYRIVLQKLGGMAQSTEMPTDVKEQIIDELFPPHQLEDRNVAQVNMNDVPLFTHDELQSAVNTMKNKKAPGPDRIPAEIMKQVACSQPDMLLNMYNACLGEGIFPQRWKVAKLVLISKGKGNPHTASAYRPLCMLDAAGKLYEKLIKKRILAAVSEAGGLSPRQYGFTAGRSTIDAISEVVSAARAVRVGSHGARDLCMAVTLDVRNAFNSVRWSDISRKLKDAYKLPGYLTGCFRITYPIAGYCMKPRKVRGKSKQRLVQLKVPSWEQTSGT